MGRMLVLLMGLAGCLQALAQGEFLLLQKNGKTLQKFFPGQLFIYQTAQGVGVAQLIDIDKGQIQVADKVIKQQKSALGITQSDTLQGPPRVIALADLKGVYFDKVNRAPTINFTEKDYNPGELANFTAPRNTNYYTTTWNTGEAGYLFSNALHAFLESNNRRKVKGMRTLGKKYRLIMM
ncbi:MAG: hypothetical protein MUF24_08075 [Chitinophagaceae bacterium]|nr:hypothetical protein [Chitinophagaceae bacterium]